MFITKKHLSRRDGVARYGSDDCTALYGIDGARSDAFAEDRCGFREVASRRPRSSTVRLAARCTGKKKSLWSPPEEGSDFEFTKILKPLEPFREYTTNH